MVMVFDARWCHVGKVDLRYRLGKIEETGQDRREWVVQELSEF